MDSSSARRGKITEENKAEAVRLKAYWQATAAQRKAAGYGSQEAFGAKFNIGNQAAVGFFLNGKTALSLKAAIGFARGLGCEVGDFSPRLAALMSERPVSGWPLSDDLLKALQGVDARTIEKAENSLRLLLDMPMIHLDAATAVQRKRVANA